jgi:acyl transferase domain-containing protein/NADPH:quinone reductase-like Zn-dependent oxidoreductase/NAD(P)-dependent dehydrogenase (short-subunit alcohol dehydrogenase family)/acyl carrier protein
MTGRRRRAASRDAAPVPVAIIGAACRLPGAEDLDALWSLLLRGGDAVGTMPADRFTHERFLHPRRGEPGTTYTLAAGTLGDISGFDPGAFGISPREAAEMDPQQRLLLEVAAEAVEDAGLRPSALAGREAGAWVGSSATDYGVLRAQDVAAVDRFFMTGNALSILSNRLTNVFDLRGPGATIDTACSSSLVALDAAVGALARGEVEMALAAGVHVLLSPYAFVGFSRASMLSPTGRCRAFDAAADGYVRAEGAVVLVLKPLDAALAAGDAVRGVILGTGVNAAGRTVGLSLPNRDAQAQLIGRVMGRAGIGADRMAYFEAHGTGTAVGDPVEAWAIGTAAATGRTTPLPVGSLKTNIGHTEPTSGLAGVLKAMLVLEHGTVPGSLHQQRPNPNIDFAALNIRVPAATEALAGLPAQRVAGVNSFGFGGTNATTLLGPAPPPRRGRAAPAGAMPPLLLSARSAAGLRALAARWQSPLESAPAREVAALARGVAAHRDLLPHRLAVRRADGPGLAAALAAWRDGGKPDAVTQGEVMGDAAPDAGGLCFVFSGNGAQWAGMAQAALAGSPRFRAAMAEVDAALAPLLGWSPASRLAEGVEAEALAATDVAQPLLFAVQAAMLPVLAAEGLTPAMVLGHSVGEVAAAHAAGMLGLDAAARLVVARSRHQQRMRGVGRMAALAATPEVAAAMIAEVDPALEIAAINGPAAVTLAGPAEALGRLGELAAARRLNFVALDLDYAFHSAAMDPLRDGLLADLAGLPASPSRLPFLSTVTGEVLGGALGDGAAHAAYWWRNLRAPVRFEAALRAALAQGARLFLEIGPTPILQSYIRETCRAAGRDGTALASLNRRDAAPGDPFPAIADRAFAAGADPRGGPAFAGPAARRLPATPFDRSPIWYGVSTEGVRMFDPVMEHPLLGFRQGLEPGFWIRNLDTEAQPWLADHRLAGVAVLPASAMLDMALAAGRARMPDAAMLEVAEFRILHALSLEPSRARALRCTLDPEGGFRLESRRRLAEEPWVLHAEGRVAAVPTASLEAAPHARVAGLEESGAAVRARAEGFGLHYGPAFAAVDSVAVDAARGAARVRLSLPPAGPADAGFVLHPARLDGAFQGLFALADAGATGEGDGMAPVRFGRLVAAAAAGPVASAELQVTRRGTRSLRASAVLRDSEGRIVARIEDATFQRFALAGADAAGSMFRIALLPAAEGPPPPPALAAARDAAQRQDQTVQGRRGDMAEVALLLEAHVAAVVQEAWGSAVSLPAAPEAAPYQAFLRRALVEDGAAVQERGGIRLVAEGALPEPAAIWRSVLDDHPALALDLAWIAEAAERLPEALRGTPRTPPRGAPPPLQGEAFARLAEPLAAAVAALAEAWPESRPLRILEVGASGVLARCVAARLAGLGRHVQYRAASAQPGTAQGSTPGMVVEEIGWDPLAGGKPPAPADLVIGLAPAARSHGGAALLAALRGVLAEGGALLLAEPLPGRVWTFVCGQDPAWWTSLGPGVEKGAEWGALPDSTLWQGRLMEAGYREVEAQPLSSAPWPSVLLSAEAPHPAATARPPAPRRVILADATSARLAELLSARLARRGAAPAILPLLETPAPHALKGQALLVLATPDAASLPATLAAVTRLAEAAHGSAESFAVVTRGGAQPAEGPHRPEAAALLGLMRVLTNEMPALRPRRIDIAPDLPADTAARRLETELEAAEPEASLSASGRFTPLLLQGVEAPAPGGALGLGIGRPGRLGTLRWTRLAERAPGPGEVTLRVEAAGLNFRDLMWAQGLLPEEVLEAGFAGPSFGMECAGVVEAVGPDVPLRPGARVFGFAPAALAARAITRVEALATLPEGLDPAAAATMPVAFLTALHGLEVCAQLQAGESVLIHGGAGAVGLAALQVAQAIGARVAMTAGTPAKRAFLRAAGADLVLDSRDPAFGDALRRAWGDSGFGCVDVVLNSLAGEAMERSLGLLRPFGRFVELGKRDFVENRRSAMRPLRRNGSYFAVDVDELPASRPAVAARLLSRIRDGFKDGTFRPLPARIFGAEEVEAAFRTLQASQHIGKLVIRPPAIGAASRPAWRPDPDRCFVVVGGTRGFGLACAKWLAARGARHLALIGRRAPGDGAALAELAALGAQAALYACDAADAAALGAVLAGIRAARPIGGVVQAAGILDDGAAIAMDEARFRRVLGPKLAAAENLDALTAEDDLSLFLMFGSATTAFGNPGQANYVAANAALEALARRRRSTGKPALTLCWGPIADVGMLADDQAKAAKLHRRLGVAAMAAEAALAMLPAALAQDHPAPLVLRLSGEEGRLALPILAEPMLAALAHAGPAPDQGALRDKLATLPRPEAEAEILRVVAEEIGRVLRLRIEAVGPDQSVTALGLDSLGAAELRGGLEQRLGLQMPLAALTEELTVGGLARQIAEVALAPEGAAEAALGSLVGIFEPEAKIQAAE